MALLEPLYRVSEICAHRGIENVVVCPGSRSAPLTLAFVRNEKFRTRVITDERSAAFVALGLAQTTGKATVLICTSGTAALNFSPAVAEAYFQGIPLLVLTADRPPEWINQQDGQTIFQQSIFGRHVVKSYDFQADYSHPDAVWMIERQTHEALAFAEQGPVHINVPVREPFYPEAGEQFDGRFRSLSYLGGFRTLPEMEWSGLLKTWENAVSIVIAVGQNHSKLDALLYTLAEDKRVTVVSDIISNVRGQVSTHDVFLGELNDLNAPDLLITCGKSFISKSLKQFFRKNKVKEHWHVEDRVELIDPFQSITTKIAVSPEYFLAGLCERRNVPEAGVQVESSWIAKENAARSYLSGFLNDCEFGELKATAMIIQNLHEGEIFHLGNSMPVRYANYLGSQLPAGVKVFSNRGTSGIEGVVSTAIGQAQASAGRVHCLVGDVSFFYDSNALFSGKAENLRIYLIQNGGGNIFRIIDGPGKQAELERCFLTDPGRSAASICDEAGYRYWRVTSEVELEEALKNNEGGPALVEIYTDGAKDSGIFRQLKAGFTS